MSISTTVVKKRGRPPAFSREYLDGLADYYRRAGKNLDRRALRDKAHMLRAFRVITGTDERGVWGVVEAFPPMRHLMDPDTGHMAQTLLTRLGRIEDEDELITTAVAVSVFKADKDADLDEVRKAWEVLEVVGGAA